MYSYRWNLHFYQIRGTSTKGYTTPLVLCFRYLGIAIVWQLKYTRFHFGLQAFSVFGRYNRNVLSKTQKITNKYIRGTVVCRRQLLYPYNNYWEVYHDA